MEIEEIKKLKKEMEQEIFESIKHFQIAANLLVEGITVTSAELKTGDVCIVKIKATVKID